MSYFIAKEIMITPKHIIMCGCSNNVRPRTPYWIEQERTDEQLRLLARDLVGNCIAPKQTRWKAIQEKLQALFEYDDFDYPNRADYAADLMIRKLNEYYQKL